MTMPVSEQSESTWDWSILRQFKWHWAEAGLSSHIRKPWLQGIRNVRIRLLKSGKSPIESQKFYDFYLLSPSIQFRSIFLNEYRALMRFWTPLTRLWLTLTVIFCRGQTRNGGGPEPDARQSTVKGDFSIKRVHYTGMALVFIVVILFLWWLMKIFPY